MPGRAAGIVGLANVGKSTLFNALMQNTLAQASNFPFCTIEPNISVLQVPDKRLAAIASVTGSQRTLGWQLEVHDIAGLVPGAASGKGLGNAFLANIRETHAILHVVRAHTGDSNIIHTESRVDPVSDLDLIDTELALADLQVAERRLGSKKAAKTPEAVEQMALLEKALPVLQDGKPASILEPSLTPKQKLLWRRLQLLTALPQVIVANVDEPGSGAGSATADVVAKLKAARPGLAVIPLCAKLEAELALLPTAEEKKEVMSAYGMTESGTDALIEAAAQLLELQAFYTTGPQESRAWCIARGSTAQQAAAEIHTDIAARLVKAEVVSFDEFMRHGGFEKAKAAGAARSEPKDYVMREGDIVIFKHS